ncbi:nodulation protein NodH [Maritimibacter sp. 55A14]|uniref:nodulation protein NodH n=1 Tax=Maritimibacter sp. 55A14 TaxID=2174844 RepID=UPI000D60A150|nr:nodulation protein NodH [Maritimibacter sp. 55A14]PWE33588.1 nodulation protein NodH [Maritimibacter sp. 55A14]
MGARRFSSFVLFAEMRTGSNFLEQNLNAFPDLRSFGELFNPNFVGFSGRRELCGITLAAREADPKRLLAAIRADAPGCLTGFRFFHDHDPRILAHCLNDPACAKVVLTRNPLDSYVSRQIAAQTGQWMLTDVKDKKSAKAVFDAAGFERHLEAVQGFQLRLLNALQTTGQSAFYIGYDDINDLDVINGLARFLGSEHALKSLKSTLKKQNPAPVAEKVSNPAEMQRALADLDRFDLSRTPNFEPRRGAGVPGFHAGHTVPILFMPVQGAPVAGPLDWLARHEARAAGEESPLLDGFNQKTLRQWKRQHPGHLSFTVLRHPLARAHDSFCRCILSTGPGAYAEIRETLRSHYGLPIPASYAPDYDMAGHRAAFLGFLEFLKANLQGQTGIRVDPAWASQAALVQGMARVAPPDYLLREETLGPSLAHLESLLVLPAAALQAQEPPLPFDLAGIYDAQIEKAARDVYTRDYMMFGFQDWSAT